jgi:integrase
LFGTFASGRCWSSVPSATGSSRRSRTAGSRGRSACWRRCAKTSPRGAPPRTSRRRRRRCSRHTPARSGARRIGGNWRKRSYKPVAEAVGINGARPYDLRHAFASLLIYEGRLSVVDIATQLGHNPTVCLDTYAHVMAEQRGAESVSADAEIAAARAAAAHRSSPDVPEELQLSFAGCE